MKLVTRTQWDARAYRTPNGATPYGREASRGQGAVPCVRRRVEGQPHGRGQVRVGDLLEEISKDAKTTLRG